jgi:hypothetical protein
MLATPRHCLRGLACEVDVCMVVTAESYVNGEHGCHLHLGEQHCHQRLAVGAVVCDGRKVGGKGFADLAQRVWIILGAEISADGFSKLVEGPLFSERG